MCDFISSQGMQIKNRVKDHYLPTKMVNVNKAEKQALIDKAVEDLGFSEIPGGSVT